MNFLSVVDRRLQGFCLGIEIWQRASGFKSQILAWFYFFCLFHRIYKFFYLLFLLFDKNHFSQEKNKTIKLE